MSDQLNATQIYQLQERVADLEAQLVRLTGLVMGAVAPTEADMKWAADAISKIESSKTTPLKYTGVARKSDHPELCTRPNCPACAAMEPVAKQPTPGKLGPQYRSPDDVPSLHSVVRDHFKNGGE